MVIADTSVWAAHLKKGLPPFQELLHRTQVMCHDFIVGELACGNLKNCKEILSLLNELPRAPLLSQDEVLHFIEHHSLMGTGIGFVDAHLLGSAYLSGAELWTLDRPMRQAATRLSLLYQP